MSYKRRQRLDDHGVDDWLMTYADMITLILCFFAIFLSISIPKKDEFQQMRSKVMEKFAADETAGKKSATITPGERDPVQGSPFVTPDMPRGVATEDDPLSGFSSIMGEVQEEKKQDESKPGDRISTIDMNSASFFAVGSAVLSDEGKKILDTVLVTVNDHTHKDYQVTIEGHTDDSPISTPQFPSNWELSTARAAAVTRYFLEQGVAPKRLRASGYADTFPKAANRDALGRAIPENQAQNRRVVIKLEKIEKDQGAGPPFVGGIY